MTNFTHDPITEIPTDTDTVHAFRVNGHIDDDASEALAKHMNGVFDRFDGMLGASVFLLMIEQIVDFPPVPLAL